jgi:hypothetical protein
MPRFQLVDPERAEGAAADLLAELAARGATPGPMLRAMANAPVLLRGYMDPAIPSVSTRRRLPC